MEASQQRRLLFVGRIDTIRNRELLDFVLELSIASFFAYQIVLNGETIESLWALNLEGGADGSRSFFFRKGDVDSVAVVV